MTKIITSIILFLISLSFTAQNNSTPNPKGIDIHVSMDKIPNDKGIVRFALYVKKGFLENPILREVSTIKNGKTEITFKNVPNNTYSIVCYHDTNENNILDFSTNGMPLEDIGVSNAIIKYGPPSFNESKFEVKDKNLNILIKF